MMEKDYSQVDRILAAACMDRLIPGAVFIAGKEQEVLFHKAYGCAQWEPEELPMTEDTLFDLASLTKVTATWPCIARLLEQGDVRLDETLPDLLPGWPVPEEMKRITLFQLLTHTAGLEEDVDLDGFGPTREERVRGIMRIPLRYPVGEGVHYSDLGFILLGEIAADQFNFSQGREEIRSAGEVLGQAEGIDQRADAGIHFGIQSFYGFGHLGNGRAGILRRGRP